jgi:integrin beta 3
MMNAEEFGRAIAARTKVAIEKAIGVLRTQLDSFETRLKKLEELPLPQNGKDGKDADPVSDEQISQAVEKFIEAHPLPVGEKGEKGDAGSPGEIPAMEMVVEALSPVVQEAVADFLKANPAPQGEKGEPGERGNDGQAGKDGESISAEQLDVAVAKYITAHPPRDGRDGRDGDRITESMLDEAIKRYVRENPIHQGRDGLGFDDLDVRYDGERNITLCFQRGEEKKEFSFSLNVSIYRGVYKHDVQYEQGDMVTWNGSVWYARQATKNNPNHNGDWQLAVKKGSDGKAGRDGKDGAAGKAGRDGKDLMMHSGR